VIPNFVITDFASQGKTWHYNIVDFNNLSCHQAYYTVLLWSVLATRTIILQGFNAKVMTGGVSPTVWQEFRNLEILDATIQLHFESKLPKTVFSEVRSCLVASYRRWKGMNDMPQNIDSAIWFCPAGHQSDQSVTPSTSWLACILDDYHGLQDFMHRTRLRHLLSAAFSVVLRFKNLCSITYHLCSSLIYLIILKLLLIITLWSHPLIRIVHVIDWRGLQYILYKSP